MPDWVVAIILVAIVGRLIMEYQQNKIKLMDVSQQNEEYVDDVRKLVNALKKRIENLEAIAAGEPDEFKQGAGAGMSEIEIEEDAIKKENQQKVSDIAIKTRTEG